MDEQVDLLERAMAEASQVVAWRRHLHRHPELSFQEVDTAQFVAEILGTLEGVEVSRPTPTSVLGRLRGDLPGPCLGLRADMDALPVTEETGLPFASERPGVMHACGHDGHTAMLLGAAKLLAEMRHLLHGEVRFIFQHAEELSPGGAQELVGLHLLDDVDFFVGQHLWAPLEAGKVGIAAGPVTAAPDSLTITVTGRGGHAAQPHLTIDPIPVVAEIVLALQQIVSRNIDPLRPVVLSVTQIHAGTADNVLPNEATIVGTVRTQDVSVQKLVAELMERTVQGIAHAHGADARVDYEKGYLPVVNDPATTQRVRTAVANLLGENAVTQTEPSMVGEDFSAYQQVAPGCFFWLGSRNEANGIVFPHHHPRFDIEEGALPLGAAALAAIALEFLAG